VLPVKTANQETSSGRGRKPFLAADVELRLLLDAGLAVLRRNGYERATLVDVLAESGLSTRAFYRQFRTTDDLLRAVFRRDVDIAIANLVATIDTAATPVEGLELWVREMLSFAFDPGRSRRANLLGFRGHRSSAALASEYERATTQFVVPLVNLLQVGAQEGVFPNARPDLDAETILGLVVTISDAAKAFRKPKLGREEAVAYVLSWALPKLRSSHQ
jgi:AcrR family transcriptional regulator